ncbi:MAG: site-specific DNA-methyltransferase [Tidjanibacter sp.]|nr:site-specific DNA-methyltransferase [Tidjanibacter sp.]
MNDYYRSANNDFILKLGDNIEILSSVEFEFDMIFADPPYFLSNGGITCQNGSIACVDKGAWDKMAANQNIDEYNRRWIEMCRNRLKPDGTIWVSGTYHNIFSIANQLNELGFRILNVITWNKNNPPPNISCRFFTHSSEFIVWARKEPKVPHYYNYELMRQINGGKQMTDVWHLPAIAKWEKSCGKHPTQKPLSLLTLIILSSTRPHDWILDPFAGSCTTGIAANLLQRRFLGVDIVSEYLHIGQSRREELNDDAIFKKYIQKLNERISFDENLENCKKLIGI